jgi:hypothetical protein
MNTQLSRRNILMAGAPAAMILALAFTLPGNSIANRSFSEQTGPHGYVVVSVVRGGQEIYHSEDHNLITNGGKDFISAQIGSTSPGTNGANYIALTTDSTSPAATDTTLASEITTGGLARAQGAYAHTTGTNTFTVSKTFTASSSFTGVQKAGLFTASSSGTMLAETTFTSVNLNSGDTLTITWTITLT